MANCADGDGATAMASRSFPVGASCFKTAASAIVVASLCGGGRHACRLVSALDCIGDKTGGLHVFDESPQISGAGGSTLRCAHGLLDFHEVAVHDPDLRMVGGVGNKRLSHSRCGLKLVVDEHVDHRASAAGRGADHS